MWKSFSDGYMQIIYDCLVDLYYIPVTHPSKLLIKHHIDYFMRIPSNTNVFQLSNLYSIRQMEQLKDHVIVCGFGRNGKEVCNELYKAGQKFVVVEQNAKQESATQFPQYLFLFDDATHDETLMKAGIQRAKAIISSLPNDPDNIYVVLTARELNKNITIVSRASNESAEVKLKRAGANHVIMPERIGGSYMASLLLKPDISEFLSSSLHSDELEFQIREIDASKFVAAGEQHTLRSLHLREKEGLLVIGLKHSNGHYIFTPPLHTKVDATDKLIVIGKS